MKAKTKSKKNGKLGRLKYEAKDVDEKPTCDLSNLRKPAETNLTTLRQVFKLFENGTDEIQCILDYECTVIYECKICRSLFRSLVNFISHKRVYCLEKFDITNDKNAIDPSVLGSLQAVGESTTETGTKENGKNLEKHVEKPDRKKVGKKDLTSVINMLQLKHQNPDGDLEKESDRQMRIIADTEQVLLQVIGSNTAAFQTLLEPKTDEIENNELMKAQTTELETILSSDTAVLGPDGKVLQLANEEKFDSPLHCFNDATSHEKLICSFCDTKFSTKKTLTFHLKSLHTPNRMVYPCPCCSNQYPSTWGVYRHLVKVHRKSNSQVRKLRADIQAKAFRTETTRAQDIAQANAKKKSKNSNSSAPVATNETQEWMAHLESDNELPRCGGCGKRFDRKAALTAHFQICQKRLAACSDAAAKSKRAKTPLPAPAALIKVESPESTIQMPNLSPAITISRVVAPEELAEISIRVEGVSSLSKDAWDKMASEASDQSDDPEIIFTKIEKAKTPLAAVNRKRKACKQERSVDSAKRGNWTASLKIEQTETPLRPVTDLETRIASITNLRKLQCVPCKRKFTNMPNLRRHMARHINWYRFRCKLCNYKCFDRVDGVVHCNKAHDAKNNRASIANMIVEIPLDEQNPKKIDVSPPDLEVIDVTVTPVDTNNQATISKDDVNKKASPSEDGIACSDDSASSPNDVTKKGKLDEDPELRRMVMEVIFGSDSPNSEQPQENSSSSSESESNCMKLTGKSMESSKGDKKIPRAPRNRTKVEDKDFIYDLDAVLMKGIAKTSENDSKCDFNDELTVLLDVSEPKLAKVA